MQLFLTLGRKDEETICIIFLLSIYMLKLDLNLINMLLFSQPNSYLS